MGFSVLASNNFLFILTICLNNSSALPSSLRLIRPYAGLYVAAKISGCSGVQFLSRMLKTG